MNLGHLESLPCSFPSWVPSRGTAGGGLVAWWLQYPLFTDKAGNIVCSQGQVDGETFENKTIMTFIFTYYDRTEKKIVVKKLFTLNNKKK